MQFNKTQMIYGIRFKISLFVPRNNFLTLKLFSRVLIVCPYHSYYYCILIYIWQKELVKHKVACVVAGCVVGAKWLNSFTIPNKKIYAAGPSELALTHGFWPEMGDNDVSNWGHIRVLLQHILYFFSDFIRHIGSCKLSFVRVDRFIRSNRWGSLFGEHLLYILSYGNDV